MFNKKIKQQQNISNDPIYTRRSIRKYKNTPLSREVIEKIIDAGRVAPSAKNRQAWKYLVYTGKAKEELLESMEQGLNEEEKNPRLKGSSYGIPDAQNTLNIMKNAPVVIMVLNINGKSPFETLNVDERFTEINNAMSIGASIENMLLKAEELGIGTLWIGNTCFAHKELMEHIKKCSNQDNTSNINKKQQLNLTEGELICAIALGYKAEQPNSRARKSLEEIVQYYD